MTHQEEIFLISIREIFPALSLQNDVSLIKKIGKEKFQNLALEIAGFVNAGINGKQISKTEEIALYCQVLHCLSRYISGTMQIPVTLNILITYFSLMPHATDLAFPGYVESGLMLYTITPKRMAI
jgi:hypothetical protein